MESPNYIYNKTPLTNNSEFYADQYDLDSYDWDELYQMTEDTGYVNPEFEQFIQYQRVRRIVLGILLIAMILIGLVGNILVIISSCRRSRSGDSAFYVFLINMCGASLVLLAFEYPLLLYENVFTQPWKMGKFFCQFHGYIQYCAFYGTAYALLLVLLFRVLQVTIPDKIVMMNNTCSASVICSIKWAIIMIANIPTWIGHGLYDEIEGSSFCYHKQLNDSKDHLHKYLIVHFTFAFAHPCIMMIALSTVLILKYLHIPAGSQYMDMGNHHRLHKSTIVMMTGLIVAFILCWGPTNIYILLLGFELIDMEDFLPLSIVSDIFMGLACANPSINPWIIIAALRKELFLLKRQTVEITQPNNNHNHQNGNGRYIHNGNIFSGTEYQSEDTFSTTVTEMCDV